MASNDVKLDSPVLTDLTRQIKSNSKSGIVSCLIRLKNEPKSYKQFARDGGLSILVNLLKYPNPKILNMSLSILANACLAADAREKVKGSKIATYVLSVIKNLKLGNSLHCRACRLIGNLSESDWHAKSLYDIGVIQALSTLLQFETNIQTRLMAVRAVRNIWSTYEQSREDIIEEGLVKIITGLLISAKEKSVSDTKYTELTEACLKAMCAFLVTLDPRCGDQMRGENDTQGYKCILECCCRNNRTAIKCLYSLCQIAECRPVLGNVGAVECLVSLINGNSDLSKETLASLCLFCREAVNRAKVRLDCGLELIIALLKNEEYEKYHPMLLHALAQFMYDDLSIVIMVKHGLLDVLVTKLRKMVQEASLEIEIEKASKKRSNESPSVRRAESKYNRTNSGRFSMDYYYDDWSPGSATSVSSSPPSTPPLPFYDSTETDENTEDNYSPVCSEFEWGENEEERQEDVESLNSCKSLTVITEDSQDAAKSVKNDNSEYMNIWTLMLLSRLSHSNEPIERLADPSTIEPLSAYIRYAQNPRASRILTRIVRNGAYLIPLVKQGFIFEAETLYDSEQYMRQLCALAETGGALGELTSILLRGEESHKFVIAVSIPFLIRSRSNLKSLLKTYGGLQLIFLVLADQHHDLYENAICSICRLASTLQVQAELLDKYQLVEKESMITQSSASDFPKSYDLPKPATVTFELDDGTTVDACRRTLCRKSDAFSAMLEGNFSESGKRRVKLTNTSKEGFNTLLLAAKGATFENRSIESLLDAVLLADKFLMSDVSDTLTESSISMLNYENFSRAWKWARNNSCHELKTYCVKSFLTAQISRTERIRAFRDFSASENFDEFLDEIRKIIDGVLCQH